MSNQFPIIIFQNKSQGVYQNTKLSNIWKGSQYLADDPGLLVTLRGRNITTMIRTTSQLRLIKN